MRFFRPALSKARFETLVEPFVFPIAEKPITKISISSDLSVLQVHATQAGMDLTLSALKSGVGPISDEAVLAVKKPVFQVRGLFPVAIELAKTMEVIRKTDPAFFLELKIYEESLESNLSDNPQCLDNFINSESHFRYFQLQGIRTEGVKHTIEFPLRSLKLNGLLSQYDLNQVILKVWLKVSEMGKNQAAKLAVVPTTTNDVPYVFRMR